VIRVPDLGEGIAEVELVAWNVKPGDAVAEDQVLADVMTEKATVEIPSPVAGKVLALGGEVGQSLAVGSELIRIEMASGSTTTSSAAVPATARLEPSSSAATPPATPVSPRTTPTPMATRTPAKQRPIASPAVRARAWELGVDLKDVQPSGTAGRIVHADLDAHRAPTDLPKVTPTPAPAHAVSLSDATHVVKIIGLRRRIAQKMQESKRRIPHFTYVEEVDVSELESLRAQLNMKWGAQRRHLTLLPFLIRSIVLAVREFPQINARFDDESGLLTQHDAVHVGIATQTDAGLMVPVLRDAQTRDLWSSATEVARLSDAARSGKAVRDELTGSTLTITSLGRLGGIMSTPVINHPEVAIIGVNRIAQRPVFHEGAIVARQLMNLSSSFDHRVVDGATAAAFVQCVRAYLERPGTLFIE
jgi:2-oxoisovalerate dehydrogenase E2 component (dihydrolipoyl transacylase)